MSCYNCKYRADIPGSAHSTCNYFNETEKILGLVVVFQAMDANVPINKITINRHGYDMGWAMWPVNFDPIWIDACKLFKAKE